MFSVCCGVMSSMIRKIFSSFLILSLNASGVSSAIMLPRLRMPILVADLGCFFDVVGGVEDCFASFFHGGLDEFTDVS